MGCRHGRAVGKANHHLDVRMVRLIAEHAAGRVVLEREDAQRQEPLPATDPLRPRLRERRGVECVLPIDHGIGPVHDREGIGHVLGQCAVGPVQSRSATGTAPSGAGHRDGLLTGSGIGDGPLDIGGQLDDLAPHRQAGCAGHIERRIVRNRVRSTFEGVSGRIDVQADLTRQGRTARPQGPPGAAR